MDLNDILGWSIFILTIGFLVVLFKIRKRKSEKQTISVLKKFAQQYNSTISYFDYWDNTMIGIEDLDAKRLFFIRNTPAKTYEEVINLSDVISCRLDKIERITSFKDDKVSIIDNIRLVFNLKGLNKSDIKLEFYNSEYDHLTISGELQLAQKWLGIVKSKLNRN